MNSNRERDDDKILYISWVFGDAERFAYALAQVLPEGNTGPGNELLDARGCRWIINPSRKM